MGSLPPTANRSRLLWANRALGVAFLGAIGSQLWVQVAHATAIVEKAKAANRFEGKVIDVAKRGSIYAGEKSVARDDDTCVLGLNFAKVPQSPGFFAAISTAVGVPASELAQLADATNGFREWKRPISQEQADHVREVQAVWKADGVSLAHPDLRIYPLGEAAANLVGIIRDQTGIAGLEATHNEDLRGVNGVTVGLKDRFGELLPMRISPGSKPKRDGQDIVLTIDPDLQVAAYEAVERTAAANGATSGSAVVMDPKTGDILAMVSWPSFDPNQLTGFKGKDERNQFKNSCVTDVLEPGSTFKILTLAYALDAGKWSIERTFTCTGKKTVGKKTFGCDRSHANGVHGTIDSDHAIAESCNLAAAEWAMKVGYEDFLTYVKRSGILDLPSVGLPAQQRALFSREKYAPELQLATLGFGQSMSASPLALCAAFSMLGNEGVRMKPRLIKSIGRDEFKTIEAGRVVSAESAERVLGFMTSVIDQPYGTADKLKIPGYSIAGKTGTAQKHNMRGAGHVSNFVGFVPAKDPKAVILVMIDDPKKLYYGAAVAGPAFRDIARAVIQKYSLQPDAEVVNPRP